MSAVSQAVMTTNQALPSPLLSSLHIKELRETVINIKTRNSAVINTEPLDVIQDYLRREYHNLKLDNNQDKKIAYRLRELQKLQSVQIQLEDSARINTRLQELSDDVISGSVNIVDVASDLHLCFLAVLNRDLACVTDQFRDSLQVDKNIKKSFLYELLSAPFNDIITFINQEQLAFLEYDYQNIFIALKHLSQKSDHDILSDLLYPVYQEIKRLECDIYQFQPGELVDLFLQYSSTNFLTSEQLRKLSDLIRSSTSCDFEEFKKQMELNFSDTREQDTFRKLFDAYYRKFTKYDTHSEHEFSSDKPLSKPSTNKWTVAEQISLQEFATSVDLFRESLCDVTDTAVEEFLDAEQNIDIYFKDEEYQALPDYHFSNQARLPIPGISPFNEGLPFSKVIVVPQDYDPFIVPQNYNPSSVSAAAEDGHQIVFLIDGIDSSDNMVEFKPDSNEPSLFIVRLKQAEASKSQNVSAKIASSLLRSSIFKTSKDSLVLSVAYGRLLLQAFPSRNIGELKQRINDPNRPNCIQLRSASMEEFDRLFERTEQSATNYILSCHFKSPSHRILFVFDCQLALVKIIDSLVRSMCYVRSTNCDMDSIYEIRSQNEYEKDTGVFKELVRSTFVSHHETKLLSSISGNIMVNSKLLKENVLPYKLTVESNMQSSNTDVMSSMECVYRSVKHLSLNTKDIQQDTTIEFPVRLLTKDEQVLRDACDMASKLTKSKENITISTLDQDRYFTWN